MKKTFAPRRKINYTKRLMDIMQIKRSLYFERSVWSFNLCIKLTFNLLNKRLFLLQVCLT
jgi:hypothetical protein